MNTLIAVVALTGILRFGDAAIIGWTTPTSTGSAGTGGLTIPETQAISTTIKTYVATTDANSVTYALTPAVSPFALSTAGVLTISAKLAADETTPTYTLHIVATDDKSATGTATVTVTVTDVDEVPVFGQASHRACIADRSTTGATLITVLATDSDLGETITHSIASGNTDTDFVINGSTGVITVSTGSTLTTSISYTLVVIAKDNDIPVQTGTTTVSVEVTSDGTCSGALTVAISIMTLLMALVVTI